MIYLLFNKGLPIPEDFPYLNFYTWQPDVLCIDIAEEMSVRAFIYWIITQLIENPKTPFYLKPILFDSLDKSEIMRMVYDELFLTNKTFTFYQLYDEIINIMKTNKYILTWIKNS